MPCAQVGLEEEAERVRLEMARMTGHQAELRVIGVSSCWRELVVRRGQDGLQRLHVCHATWPAGGAMRVKNLAKLDRLQSINGTQFKQEHLIT